MERNTVGGFTWIHLDDPAADELASARDELGLPPFITDVALRDHHRTRIERHGELALLVLKPVGYDDEDEIVRLGQLVVLVGPGSLVTVGNHDAITRGAISDEVATDPDRLAMGPASVVHVVLDHLVDSYLAVLDALDEDVDDIESQVFSDRRGSHAERIYRLKSEVQDFRRAAAPLPEELDALIADSSQPWVALGHRLRDVRARALRASEHLDHLDGLLNGALAAHLAKIGVQQNDDMRRISAWVAIIAAPAAVASIYGMNFRFMPELEWRFGYFVVLGLMAAICLALYRSFRHSGWL